MRGGRALGAWLRELVAEDASTRLAAGEALRAMMWGLPTAHTKLAEVDWGSATPMSDQRERFNAAVRAAVDAPGFDAAGFVRELILYRMITSEDFMRRFEKRHELDSDLTLLKSAPQATRGVQPATTSSSRSFGAISGGSVRAWLAV